MKYGVLIHKYTQNLGDDVQSFAISQHLPHVDYMVDREELDTFQSKDNEPVSVIMSAWWLWKKWNWPPASCILPKLIGMHIADKPIANKGTPIYDECFKGLGGSYLNSYGPVGCRDYDTIKLFNNVGVDNYFSGCITLTIPKMEIIKPKQEYICLVDIDKKIEKNIREKLKGTNIEIKIMTHNVNYTCSNATWEEREKFVRGILTTYQNAKCVVTRRLHVSLPCLAMDVPVLCILENIKSDRFDPYKDWIHMTNKKEFLNGKCDYDILNPKENLKKHLETKEKLTEDIRKFIEDNKNVKSVDEFIKTKYTELEKLQWQNQLMKETLDKWLYQNREIVDKIKQLSLENKRLKQEKAGKKLKRRKFKQTKTYYFLKRNYLKMREIYSNSKK